jgi:hypothetical protein
MYFRPQERSAVKAFVMTRVEQRINFPFETLFAVIQQATKKNTFHFLLYQK